MRNATLKRGAAARYSSVPTVKTLYKVLNHLPSSLFRFDENGMFLDRFATRLHS